MTKPKTQKQLDAATDARLRKTYGISLAEYDKLAEVNNGCCWVSGRPAGTRRLHVDHDHSWKKVPILSYKAGVWVACATYNTQVFMGHSLKKSLAIRDLKQQLLRASVRGLLSYSINAGMQKFSDDPVLLREAATYLEKFKIGSTRRILD